MRIVLATVSSNPDFNGNCDLALVDLSPAYAQQILVRMKALLALAAADPALSEGHYWDSPATYFAAPPDEELRALLNPAAESQRALADGVELPERLIQRVEYRHLVIAVSGGAVDVSWRASPKNVSIYIETEPLPQATIEALASGGWPVAS